MIPVDQTVFGFEKGNCFQACAASIFELRLDEVPNFMENGIGRFNKRLEQWCERIRYSCIDVTLNGIEKTLMYNCYMIACGKSPRATGEYENENHGVVWYNGKMVHDPHPSKEGIAEYPELFSVFIPWELRI